MKTGMLWFDGDKKKPLDKKIQTAAGYYEKKYGAKADLCFVNPGEMEESGLEGIQVQPDARVLKGHLYLGKKEG